jgi:hypothetical protein
MKRLWQSKLATRLLVLAALTMTLGYLRAPTQTRASERVSCVTECDLAEDRCLEGCGAPPPQGCFQACITERNECVAQCN